MSNVFEQYITSPSNTISETVFVMAGTEPMDCPMVLDNQFGVFDPQTQNPEERARRFQAKKFFNEIMEDLPDSESCLEVRKLTALIKAVKVGDEIIKVESCSDLMQLIQERRSKVEPEILISGAAEIFEYQGNPYITVKDPSKFTMREVHHGRWVANSLSKLSTDSVTKWVQSRGINCEFSQYQKTENHMSFGEQDLPSVFSRIIEIRSKYLSDESFHYYKSQCYLFQHGSQKVSTKRMILDYLKNDLEIQSVKERERIASVVAPEAGKTSVGKAVGKEVYMPCFEKYLRDGELLKEQESSPRISGSPDPFLRFHSSKTKK